MSYTDDKTPCPCGPELRRFEAADLKAAILGERTEDEDGDYEDDGDDSWYKLESGVPVPDENYDPEAAAESERLYQVWRNANDWVGNVPERAAWDAHRQAHDGKLYPTKQVPWTFKWNGKELEVKVVQDNGGTEGGGEQAHMIYQVCDRLFRLDGSYYSYDGTTWDDDSFREVKAVERVVTYYE